jgi:D-alanyl-D-alanine carboxypeptidase
LIATRLLDPLNLTETRYNTEHPGGTIHGYGTELRSNADTWKYAENTGADSGVTATSSDLSRFLKALFLNGGEFTSIGKAMLVYPVERDRPRQFAGPGAEILVSRSGTEFVGHTGDTFGYLTFAFAVPEYDATMVGQVTANKENILVGLLTSTASVLEDACKSR